MTHQEFLSDLFAEWSDDDLAEFVFDARAYADDRQTGRTLTRATEIAGNLAGAELEAREKIQRRIQQEIWANLDAMYTQQEWQRSETERLMTLDAHSQPETSYRSSLQG